MNYLKLKNYVLYISYQDKINQEIQILKKSLNKIQGKVFWIQIYTLTTWIYYLTMWLLEYTSVNKIMVKLSKYFLSVVSGETM